jgi:hypothetical protein
MNAKSPEFSPVEAGLPLSDVAIVLTKAMDQLLMDTVRPLSLEEERSTRAELCAIAIAILEGGKQKAADLPFPPKTACILPEGEFRILAGMLKALVTDDTWPVRSVVFELLVTLMGNGWRRAEHVNAVRV